MSEYVAIHRAANYYEPLFRARFVRAMKALRASIRIQDIALAIAHKNPHLLTLQITDKLAPASLVVRDAVNQGGKIGAEKVRKL